MVHLTFWLHLSSTLFMTGLIWFVQVVHYPLFLGVGATEFTEYATKHQQLTGLVVILPMVCELLTAGVLALHPASPLPSLYGWLGLGSVALIWASTFFLQVPEHARLASGVDPDAIARLVRTNWVRTVLWTLRSGLLITGLATSNIVLGQHP